MAIVISKDGTEISYERLGAAGPPVILVDGALCSSTFGPMPKIAARLANDFTVFVYDRRGRGKSGDTPPYSSRREVEDIAALIEEAGGSACLVGLSSGAALALEAAATVSGVTKVAAYEPPYIAPAGDGSHKGHEAALRELIADGRRGDAVKYFMRVVGVPAVAILMMQIMPFWSKLKAVAHTLPYDMAVMGDFTVPAQRIAAIRVPALVIAGEKTQARLIAAVDEIARALPSAKRRMLAGQTHNVSAAALAPELVGFFAAGESGAPSGREKSLTATL